MVSQRFVRSGCTRRGCTVESDIGQSKILNALPDTIGSEGTNGDLTTELGFVRLIDHRRSEPEKLGLGNGLEVGCEGQVRTSCDMAQQL